MTNYEMVREFHKAFGLTVNKNPIYPSQKDINLRWKLLNEEFDEVAYEFSEEGSLEGLAKELADLLYVVYGTGITYGFDMDRIFAEVHRSNMSKLTEDGKVLRREDGKVLKGRRYTPANLRTIQPFPVEGEEVTLGLA